MAKPDLSPFAKLPRFPDGRINYAGSGSAAVVHCFVKCRSEILLLKRSGKVGNYKNTWSVVVGYFDHDVPVEEMALEELREEVGVTRKNISAITTFKPAWVEHKLLGKRFLTHIVLVELKTKPKIKLDWEHTEYKWIKPKDIKKIKNIVYDLPDELAGILK